MRKLLTLCENIPELEANAGDELGFATLEFLQGNQRIKLGDCTELMMQLGEASIDVVVTSPPYNIGKAYRTSNDRLSAETYLDWIRDVVTHLERILTPGGSVFLNVDGCARHPWQAFDVAAIFREKFMLQNEFVWVKSITVGQQTYGHFKPLNSKRFVNRTHEKIFHFTRNGDVPVDRLAIGVPYQDKSNVLRWGPGRRDLRCVGNVWFVPYATVPSNHERAGHPATFPVELARRCLKLVGAKGVVLDPFAGTGSTLVAAQELGMAGIGMEIDIEYAWAAYERLQQLT